MFTHRRQRLLAIALGLTSLLAWWFGQRPPSLLSASASPDSRRPDHVVDGLRALAFDIHGQPLRELRADQLRHYADEDSSELERPRLKVFDGLAPPWLIRAERGFISSRAERVILSGEVHARRDAGLDSQVMSFNTSEITLYPDDQYAETDRFVELESGLDSITAINGMRFWYSEPQRGSFFGRVRARIATGSSTLDKQNQHNPLPSPGSSAP